MIRIKVLLGVAVGFAGFVIAESVTNNLDVQGGFIYNHGVINPGDVGMTFTSAGIRDVTVSAGQLSGVDPETGIVITNSENLLSLKAKSLMAVSNVTAGGRFIGDGAGISNLNFQLFNGSVQAAQLPTSGVWNASGVMVSNLNSSGDLNMNGFKISELGNSSSDADAVNQGRVKTMMQQVPEYGDISMGIFSSQMSLPERVIPTVIQTEDIEDEAVTLNKIASISNRTVLGNMSGAISAPVEIAVLDEDDMVSDSDAGIPTQQSVKKYADTVAETSAKFYAMQYCADHGSNPVHSGLFVSGADVWTDLNLSSVIGTNRAIVFLRVQHGAAGRISFRMKGETKNMNAYVYNATGYSSGYADADEISTPSCITSDAGMIQYCSTVSGTTNNRISVIAYQILQ